MNELKNLIGVLAVFLVFIGYLPYLVDIKKGKTKPHIYSWFLWAFVTFIAFALQYTAGAGPGGFVTLAASFMCALVMIFGFIYKTKVQIKKIDSLFLFFAFVALGLWLFAKQPVLSAILTTLIDLLGFAPTIRKSWHQPYTETISFYFFNSLRFFLAILALQTYTFVTTFYPAAWLLGNGLFALFLIYRRRVVGK